MLFDSKTAEGVLLIAGWVLEAFDAPLLLIPGCTGVGAFVGTVVAWMRDPEPDWAGGAGRGILAGGVVGMFATLLDYTAS